MQTSVESGVPAASGGEEALDPTSRLIIDEARRRDIEVEILAPRAAWFRLRRGTESVLCRESLSARTSAVALSLCDDKRTTSRVLRAAGLSTPAQTEVGSPAQAEAFLRAHGTVVVKPARGEQGRGISVGLCTPDELRRAIARAGEVDATVILEQYVTGVDLRVIVIDDEVVAAAVRRPPEVTGTGRDTVGALIVAQSARRAAETAGESKIPLDEETERCVREAGYQLSDRLPAGETITVRRAANVHTGGTIYDVTGALHPTLAEAARSAARALEIPVVGIDMLVPDAAADGYFIIEANERPGFAHHEPQPVAAHFVNFLFPGLNPRK